MASAYHNLKGVIRDLERACNDGDFSVARAFVDLIEDVRDAFLDDAEDTPGEGGDAGLGVPDQPSLPGMERPAEGHDSVRPNPVDQFARLREQVERLTALAALRQEGPLPSDVAAVAATVHGRRLVKPAPRESLT